MANTKSLLVLCLALCVGICSTYGNDVAAGGGSQNTVSGATGAVGSGKDKMDAAYAEMKKKMDTAANVGKDKASGAKDRILEGIDSGKAKAEQAFVSARDKLNLSPETKKTLASAEAKKAYAEASQKAAQMARDFQAKMKSNNIH